MPLVLVGASTGGPGLIEKIVAALPTDMKGILVLAQHMDTVSLNSFGKRLHRLGPVPVRMEKETPLHSGNIYLLSDSAALTVRRGSLYLVPAKTEKSFYHPTIDTLFHSAADLPGYKVTAFLLSGIGADGVEGLVALKKAGFATYAQDEASSVVYGMPKKAVEREAVVSVLPIQNIVEKIRELLSCSAG